MVGPVGVICRSGRPPVHDQIQVWRARHTVQMRVTGLAVSAEARQVWLWCLNERKRSLRPACA